MYNLFYFILKREFKASLKQNITKFDDETVQEKIRHFIICSLLQSRKIKLNENITLPLSIINTLNKLTIENIYKAYK